VTREQISSLKLKGEDHWERKRKNRFAREYLRQKWFDLCQTKTHSTHIVELISPAEMHRLC